MSVTKGKMNTLRIKLTHARSIGEKCNEWEKARGGGPGKCPKIGATSIINDYERYLNERPNKEPTIF